MSRSWKKLSAGLLSATLCVYAVAACSDDPSSPADRDNAYVGSDHATETVASDADREMNAGDPAVDAGTGDEEPVDPGHDAEIETSDADEVPDVDATDLGDDPSSEPNAILDLAGDPDLELEVVDPCAPRSPPDTRRPWSRVGTGFGAFESVAPCQELPIIEGLQEGYHVWGGFEAGGFDAGDDLFVFAFEITRDGVSIAEAVYNDLLGPYEREEDGTYAYHTVPVVLHPEIDPEALVGQSAVLSVELSRDGDVDLTDSVPIVLGEIER